MNNVNLIGRIATDVKIGNGVVSTLMAVHRIYHSHDVQDTDFIPLSIFGRQADNFSKMVSKGELIGVDGQLKTSEYVDKSTGEKRYGWSVAVDHFYLLGSEHHEGGQQKLSQQVVSDGMHSSSTQQQQQDLYNQYHQQTAQTPQPAIDKQLDDLDHQLDKAKQPDKQSASHPTDSTPQSDEPITPLPPLGHSSNRSHVSGNDFSEKVIDNQPTVKELQQEIKDLKAKALPF